MALGGGEQQFNAECRSSNVTARQRTTLSRVRYGNATTSSNVALLANSLRCKDASQLRVDQRRRHPSLTGEGEPDRTVAATAGYDGVFAREEPFGC